MSTYRWHSYASDRDKYTPEYIQGFLKVAMQLDEVKELGKKEEGYRYTLPHEYDGMPVNISKDPYPAIELGEAGKAALRLEMQSISE